MTTLLDSLFGRVSHVGRSSSLLARLNSVSSLYRSRVRLGQLDDHMLDDIGVSEAQAKSEAGRSIWDAPTTWKL